MIDHISIGVGNIGRTKRFYDAAFRPLGYSCLSESDGTLGYGRDGAEFWVYQSKRPINPDPGSGLHFSFVAPTRDSVNEFHAAALKAGGNDNGKPGLRQDYGDNYYAAFVIDPDGYRIEAHCSAER
jgi:catechol 2,3-dioxygenase-like lactoylglutathione lyase family enzyme